MKKLVDQGIENVPEITQLIVLPFLSGIAGVLANWGNKTGYRATLHRTMCRHDEVYLQQIVNYVSSDATKTTGAGRVFAVDTGIIGGAFHSKSMHHTRTFATREDHLSALNDSLIQSNEIEKVNAVGLSYLAIPFLGLPDSSRYELEITEHIPLAILYAECFGENIFADDKLLEVISGQCNYFADVLDKIVEGLPDHVRNFSYPIYDKSLVIAGDAPYDINKEPDTRFPSPTFKNLRSLNFQFS